VNGRLDSRRVTLLATSALVLLGGLGVHRFWLRQLHHVTGSATWVWVTDSLERVFPTAGLFVAPLHLDAPPREALLKVCGDREYVVYVNGSPAACGWSRPGFRLDLYDIGHLLRQGQNLIAVEVRSPTPVGGLLVSLDVEGLGPNVLESGRSFTLRRRFSLSPGQEDDVPPPVVWGRPPRFPWQYPSLLPRPRTLDEVVVEEPYRLERTAARELPGGGMEFTLPRRTFGYLWFEYGADGASFAAVVSGEGDSDIAALRDEAQPVIRLAGQRRWLDPQPRWMSRIYAFGRCVPLAAEVWPVPEDFRPTAPGVVPGRHGPVPRTRWTSRIPPE